MISAFMNKTSYGKVPFSMRKKVFFACDISPENQYKCATKFINHTQELQHVSCLYINKARFVFVIDPSGDLDYNMCYLPGYITKDDALNILNGILDIVNPHQYFNVGKIKYMIELLSK